MAGGILQVDDGRDLSMARGVMGGSFFIVCHNICHWVTGLQLPRNLSPASVHTLLSLSSSKYSADGTLLEYKTAPFSSSPSALDQSLYSSHSV
jgi:hypothetical protein